MIVTHEWLGEPHNSASIKKINGVEVARNYVPNPNFEKNTPVSYGNTDSTELVEGFSVYGSTSVKSYANREGATRLGVNWQIDTPEGYAAMRCWVYIPSTNSFGSSRINFQTTEGVYWHVFEAVYDEWFSIERHRQFTTPQTGSFWIGIESIGASVGDEIYYDGVQMSVSDTQEDATRQVETYFDGDTPDYSTNTLKVYSEGDWREYSPTLYV